MKQHLILLLSALAGIAAAENVPHNMVSRHTPVNTNLIGAVIGEGLSLSNGVLSSTGGGGLDGQAVTNIVKGVVADAGVLVTNASGEIEAALKVGDLYSDGEINLAGVLLSQFGQLYYRNSLEEYDPERELAVKGDIPDLNNYARTDSLGTAAFKDASEFATAADEALVYQLITNRLSGVTFDFATVAGLYLAISNIVAAQGGAITNFPAIP